MCDISLCKVWIALKGWTWTRDVPQITFLFHMLPNFHQNVLQQRGWRICDLIRGVWQTKEVKHIQTSLSEMLIVQIVVVQVLWQKDALLFVWSKRSWRLSISGHKSAVGGIIWMGAMLEIYQKQSFLKQGIQNMTQLWYSRRSNVDNEVLKTMLNIVDMVRKCNNFWQYSQLLTILTTLTLDNKVYNFQLY